jgi:peptidoglycan hydrolase-like protein with peptidoglycan-binding domain
MKFAWFALSMFILGAAIVPGSGQQPPASPKKPVAAKKTTPKKRVAATRRTASRTPAASRQAAPTAERYKEIQQALASKGYLKSEPSGVWDADSVAAMRQFQTDRKLDPSGKLTAAALIDLGLGPHPETSPKIEPAPAPQP